MDTDTIWYLLFRGADGERGREVDAVVREINCALGISEIAAVRNVKSLDCRKSERTLNRSYHSK